MLGDGDVPPVRVAFSRICILPGYISFRILRVCVLSGYENQQIFMQIFAKFQHLRGNKSQMTDCFNKFRGINFPDDRFNRFHGY